MDALAPLADAIRTARRVVVLGMGNELRGDDAAGLLVADRVQELLAGRPAAERAVEIIVGSTAPENCTGQVRRFRPDLVVIVDAASFTGAPGEVRVIDPETLAAAFHSTHTLPLSMLAGYLAAETGAHIVVVGIQATATELDTPPAAAVAAAAGELADALAAALAGPV